MPSESARVLACQRYVRFLFKSYLKWQTPRDVCDVSSLVRFYPSDFYDVLRTQIMLQLETEYSCTASGWLPEVECKVVPEESALSLNIWFTRAPKKPSAQRQ